MMGFLMTLVANWVSGKSPREQELKQKVDDLILRLGSTTHQRDDLRARLQALEHSIAERATAPVLERVLQDNHRLMETIIRQRQFIRALYTSRAKKLKRAKP